MKELSIYNLTGWMNGLYNISLKNQIYDDTISYFDVNNLFWNDLFSKRTIQLTINNAIKTFSIYDNISDKVLAAINSADVFCELVLESVSNIKDTTLNEVQIFEYLETIQIYCDIYSALNSSAFKLSIDSGYICSSVSSKYMYQNCISENFNPYTKFIKKKVLPEILSIDPQVIWLEGRISIATFAIARFIKQYNPHIFIGISKFSNEYYSLNKILPLLQKNEYFFKTFDCVVLDESIETKKYIVEAIQSSSLETVNNIIYKNSLGEIITNNTNSITPNSTLDYIYQIDTKYGFPVNIRLFPNNHCYWSKCNFCGINRKYKHLANNLEWDIDAAITLLRKLSEEGINSFWATDEAIPVQVISKLTERIISEKLHFNWHFRTRIESELLNEELIKNIKQAGVTHILLGFESASSKILNLMNKTTAVDYVDVAEKIVCRFNANNIKVHFPIIIGFPNEDKYDREITFKFLKHLKNHYDLFSFNINIFYLDIASNIFHKWLEYNISTLNFTCEPDCFIGNIVEWNSPNKLSYQDLYSIVKAEMKNMFPWYMDDALIPINTFYMLLESMKYPLFESKDTRETKANEYISQIKNTQKIEFNKCVSRFKNSENLFCLYNLKNHQSVSGGQIIYDLSINSEMNAIDLIKKYPVALQQQIEELILFLMNNDFLQLS